MNKVRILSSEYGTFRVEIQDFFIRELLKEKPRVIFDPMAGTAPLIPFIETNGIKAYLNDILPIHFFVNKAKEYQVYQHYRKHGHEWFFQRSLNCMSALKNKVLCMSDKWIDDSVLQGLIQAWHAVEQYDRNSETLLKAVILLSVRPLSSTTRTRNPTWLKSGGISTGKKLKEIVRESLIRFDKYYRYHYGSCRIKKRGRCIITHCNSTELHLSQEVDWILTSPPYCNRIEPMTQYGPENYFLSAVGYASSQDDLVSTTKVRGYNKLAQDLEFLTTKSKYARALLNKIKQSPVGDDPGYYLKYYTRYFATLYRLTHTALTNLREKGKMYIVTQDNIHRGELIEIDKVLRQLLKTNGWESRIIKRWERHHMGLQNVSRNHAFVRPKHFEKLMVVWQ